LLAVAQKMGYSTKSVTCEIIDDAELCECIGGGGGVSRTYTLDGDFDEGVFVGVEHETMHNQLQLTETATTLPFIWVPNSNEGTVSKVDTVTGDELGRYRVGPSTCNPSRTTVDLQGNCWVGNRGAGTVVKIGLYEAGQGVDRDGNGVIDTSHDTDGDGNITGDEILAWGEDECVLYEIVLISGKEGPYTPGTYTGGYDTNNVGVSPRGLAIDASNNLWAGAYSTKKYYYIDGSTGAILKTVDVSPHHAYGAVIDGNGILWSSGQNLNHVLRLDPSTDPPTISTLNMEHYVYGLGIDASDHLFMSGWQNYKLSRVNILTSGIDWTKSHSSMDGSRGVAVTSDGDVWVANSDRGSVSRYDNDGNFKTEIPVGNCPTGVAVDAVDKVWVCNHGDEYIKRVDPSTNSVDLSKRIIGGRHYSYSDMTGIVARTVTTKTGTWTVDYDSGTADTAWGTISWNNEPQGSEPAETSITVEVRSSNDQSTWSAWEAATNGVTLSSTSPGRYLQIRTTLQSTSGDVSPILSDLTVESVGGGGCEFGTDPVASDFTITSFTTDKTVYSRGETMTITMTVLNSAGEMYKSLLIDASSTHSGGLPLGFVGSWSFVDMGANTYQMRLYIPTSAGTGTYNVAGGIYSDYIAEGGVEAILDTATPVSVTIT
jgi:streptogramin lyase